jgi:hypothetical protein
MNIILMIMSTFNLKHIVKMLYKHRYMKNSKFVISESLNLHVVKMGRWERWCVHGCWDHSHQTKPNQPTMGLGLTHTREQCFYKKQLQTWLDLFHIYIYTINCQCVHSLFVGTKTDEFNKTIKLTCPLSVHPQSKQIKFETLVAASGRDHTEPKDNILCCIPTISLSLKWLLVTNVRL